MYLYKSELTNYSVCGLELFLQFRHQDLRLFNGHALVQSLQVKCLLCSGHILKLGISIQPQCLHNATSSQVAGCRSHVFKFQNQRCNCLSALAGLHDKHPTSNITMNNISNKYIYIYSLPMCIHMGPGLHHRFRNAFILFKTGTRNLYLAHLFAPMLSHRGSASAFVVHDYV